MFSTCRDVGEESVQGSFCEVRVLLVNSAVWIGTVCRQRGGPQQVSPRILCRSWDMTRPSSPRLMFLTTLQTHNPNPLQEGGSRHDGVASAEFIFTTFLTVPPEAAE